MSTLVATGLQVAQTVILARILVPGDFGLMAVAGGVVAFLSLLVDLGLSQALIHYDDVSRHAKSSIFWLNMLLGGVLTLALLVAAPLLGKIYHSEPLASLLAWTSLIFPLAAAGQQLRALAAKALRFDLLAPIDIVAAMAGLACAVIVSLLGGGVYALVAGLLTRTGTDSLLVWLRLPADFRPKLHFHPRETLPYLGFGGYAVGETLANQFHRYADVFMGGLVVGPAAMGIYAVPRELTMKAGAVLNNIVTKVGFPVMSQVKNEPARLRNIYLQTLRMTSSVNFPLYVAVGLFSKEIVALLYGSQWHGAATYLRILAAWGLIRSTANPGGSLLYATGQTKRAFWWNLALLVLLPPLYWLATHVHGLLGLAAGVTVLQLILVIPGWWFVIRPCCGARLSDYLSQFLAPLVCALMAGATAWLAVHNLPHGTLRIAAGFAVGGAVYVATSWFLNRRWVQAMMELLHVRFREKTI